MSEKNAQPKIKNIEVGKFYHLHDGSQSGHPGLIVWKSDEFNLYLAIKFGTSKNKNNIALNKSVGGGAKKSFIYKRPILLKRKNIGTPFDNLIYEDIEGNISKFLENNIIESKDINRKDRRNYKRLNK